MASSKEHSNDCIKELGEPFTQVHIWLDEYFLLLFEKHREVRHHKKGVEDIRKMWGDKAARAAEIHILKDYGTNKVPTEEEARLWRFFGPDCDIKGTTKVENIQTKKEDKL